MSPGLSSAIPLRARRRPGGFTLLEVVLAVAISIGVLLVLLVYYRQTAELRTQLLLEAERVSEVRMVMDQITADLRCARADAATGAGFSGGGASLRFAKAGLPSMTAWTGSQLGRAAFAETDLRWVDYSMGSVADGTNLVATGLVRSEESGVEKRARRVTGPTTVNEDTPAVIEPPVSEPVPLGASIHYLRFRYLRGSDWLDSWNEGGLPAGVEITLAWEPPVEELEFLQDSSELFRRVVVLPAGGAGSGEPVDLFDLMEEEAP